MVPRSLWICFSSFVFRQFARYPLNLTLWQPFDGLCFINLVDFDMVYGHRNDVEGYTDALNAVDVQIGQMMEKMRPGDLLKSSEKAKGEIVGKTEEVVSREKQGVLYEEK